LDASFAATQNLSKKTRGGRITAIIISLLCIEGKIYLAVQEAICHTPYQVYCNHEYSILIKLFCSAGLFASTIFFPLLLSASLIYRFLNLREFNKLCIM
jgi:hypothetical protein